MQSPHRLTRINSYEAPPPHAGEETVDAVHIFPPLRLRGRWPCEAQRAKQGRWGMLNWRLLTGGSFASARFQFGFEKIDQHLQRRRILPSAGVIEIVGIGWRQPIVQ